MRPAARAPHSRVLPISFDLSLLHAANPARYPHLLESVARGDAQARYDILFAFPGETLMLDADGGLRHDGRNMSPASFLTQWDSLWRKRAQPAPETSLPFSGGWFLYLGYELAGEIESRVRARSFRSHVPIAVATHFPAAIIRDHQRGETTIVGESALPTEQLDAIQADIAQRVETSTDDMLVISDVQEDEPETYLARVRRIKDYIAAGDVFQVNLARAWHARLDSPLAPVQLYRRLRRANPAPYACLATFGERRAVISSSPERLVEVRGRRVRTRPIAGTYPRGQSPAQDAALSRELLAHPKERAEHVMLLDLERNDLGRVCRPGSVRVSELMTLESYQHVHHIVSEVTGELRPTVTPTDVIRAVFPGGTITGCPKVRCMEIINELEAGPRGAYTGSTGYVNHDGSMDLNILIRTLVQDDDRLSLHAGAGIVADSDPARELAETRAKAKGLLAALGLA